MQPRPGRPPRRQRLALSFHIELSSLRRFPSLSAWTDPPRNNPALGTIRSVGLEPPFVSPVAAKDGQAPKEMRCCQIVTMALTAPSLVEAGSRSSNPTKVCCLLAGTVAKMHLSQASAARVIIYDGKMNGFGGKEKGSGEPLPQIVASVGTIRS